MLAARDGCFNLFRSHQYGDSKQAHVSKKNITRHNESAMLKGCGYEDHSRNLNKIYVQVLKILTVRT